MEVRAKRKTTMMMKAQNPNLDLGKGRATTSASAKEEMRIVLFLNNNKYSGD